MSLGYRGRCLKFRVSDYSFGGIHFEKCSEISVFPFFPFELPLILHFLSLQ